MNPECLPDALNLSNNNMPLIPDNLVLFDGVCNLCNTSVQFIIERDPKQKFYFSSLQSETGKFLLQKYKIDTQNTDSLVLIQNGKAYIKSTAALRIASQLKGPVKILSILRILPKFLRNLAYDIVAKNRYLWFGKREHCMIPSPALRKRFLD